ncbi:MAG TPA: Do family serine endopeptidase [Candidatus Binatia bacterium]|jgi:serine protease Do
MGLRGAKVLVAAAAICSLSAVPAERAYAFVGRTTAETADFVSLSKKLKPVVVNISATQSGRRAQERQRPSESEDPFSDLWGGLFGNQPRGRASRQTSLGSGFILERDGTILTNNHVVENAEKIVVKLVDGRELPARIVGTDPKTDIAVIKIDPKTPLPTAPLGDSDKLEVGEWVVAIGNPFGLDNTVTSGIVSATGRHIGASAYDDFIQTDASINPGNSGGPLINMRGEVVGINAAIVSGSGGNVGIGFATPINLVKELLPQLKQKGTVTRGALGVSVQRVTPAIADTLGLNKARGALVANVSKGGPADRAGVKVGDVLTEYNGKEIKDADDLPLMVARTPVDKRVTVKVLREKKAKAFEVTIGELKDDKSPRSRSRNSIG